MIYQCYYCGKYTAYPIHSEHPYCGDCVKIALELLRVHKVTREAADRAVRANMHRVGGCSIHGFEKMVGGECESCQKI